MLVGEVRRSPAPDARGLLDGGLRFPTTGESAKVVAGSNNEEEDMLGAKPEIVFRLARDPEPELEDVWLES